jgi:hypothetical protein
MDDIVVECEENFSRLSDHDSASEAGAVNAFILYNSYKNNT